MIFKHFVTSLFLATFISTACTHIANSTQSRTLDDDIIESLKDGNIRFTSHQKIHPRQDKDRIFNLSKGQSPEVVLVSCSDSRVPPELVFDQGLGDIFSVRTAGHVLDVYSVASIEYAVDHLGSKVIIVMGHTSCGALKAAVTSSVGNSTGSANIDKLITKIRPGIKSVTPSDGELIEAAKSNVEASIAYLKQTSPLIRHDLETKTIKIVAALYYLKTGDVELW